VRFRPSKRALGKLTEGHPDARDSPAVPQIRSLLLSFQAGCCLKLHTAGVLQAILDCTELKSPEFGLLLFATEFWECCIILLQLLTDGVISGPCAQAHLLMPSAAAQLRPVCASRDFDVQHSEAGLLQGSRAGEWEGSNTPSNRVWLGNISATATLRSVRSVFSKFGPLTDAAVFPARIGPLGYAFVNFEKVSDAAGAYQALNNVVLPALTGCKQLKMRFKPAKVCHHLPALTRWCSMHPLLIA